MRKPTAILVLAAGCAAVLAFAGPALAADWNAGYSVYMGSGAAGAGDVVDQGQEVDGANGTASVQSPLYGSWPGEGSAFSCAPTGCEQQRGVAGASVDEAAGVLRASAGGGLLIGNAPDPNYGGSANISASAGLDDAITLSQAATVVLKGTVTGSLAAANSYYEYLADPAATLRVDLKFGCTQPEWTPDGPRCVFDGPSGFSDEESADVLVACSEPDPSKCPGAGTIPFPPSATSQPETFSVPVSLPAGTSPFSADVATVTRLLVDGMPDMVLSQDAFADYADRGAGVTFEIDVPDGVCATSESGLLPIVGGTCTSSDTTAPTTTASVDSKPNAAGWYDGPVTVDLTATDDDGGSGVASISYSLNGGTPTVVDGASASIPLPEGVTTIRYFATDRAGNEEPAKTLTVEDDETPPVLSLPAGGQVTVDATGPTGAQVDYRVTAADNLDPSPAVACSQGSGTDFPIGETSVTCTATDAAGNRSSGSFRVYVRSAAEQLASLDERISGVGLPPGTANSLHAKVRAAGSALARGDSGATCGILGALRNEIAAQCGKKLPGDDARELDSDVARIEAVAGC